jgi:hypothetical protein
VLYCIYLVNIFDYRRTKDMLSNDANILKIKHEILYQVAKLTYAGQLEEKKEELPYELLPGPQAQYKLCLAP